MKYRAPLYTFLIISLKMKYCNKGRWPETCKTTVGLQVKFGVAFINIKCVLEAGIINCWHNGKIWPAVLYLGFCCFCLLVCTWCAYFNTNFNPYVHNVLFLVCQRTHLLTYSLISCPHTLIKFNPRAKIMRLIFAHPCELTFESIQEHVCMHVLLLKPLGIKGESRHPPN